jgi:hypothetical protein
MGILEIKEEDYADNQNVILTLSNDDTIIVNLAEMIVASLEHMGDDKSWGDEIIDLIRSVSY